MNQTNSGLKIWISMMIVLIILGIGAIIYVEIKNYRNHKEFEKIYQQQELELTNSKFVIEINDKKYDNCSYKDGTYYTENGGEIYFGKESHVILKKEK
jgi:hypothetical protein